MKLKGKLITEKTRAELMSTFIPDQGIFEDMKEEDKPIITYNALTSSEYSQTFLNMGMLNSSKIDFVELVIPRIVKIENLELEDGTKIITGEQLGNITASDAVMHIISGLGFKLIEAGRYTETEVKN